VKGRLADPLPSTQKSSRRSDMGNLVVKAALAYIESHPAVIEQIVEYLFQELLKYIQAQKPAA